MKLLLKLPILHLVGIAFFAFHAVGTPALAESIILSPAGLPEPVGTITFDELDIADTAPVSTQFAELGATFLPALFYRVGDHPDWQNVQGPNLRTGEPEVNPFSIKFANVLASAAVTLIAQPPTPATITAKLNGAEVETMETTISIDNPDNYFGFSGIAFDEIEVNYGNRETRLRIDNVQLGERAEGFEDQFEITDITRGADGVVNLTWESREGEFFDVEMSGDLTPGSWQPLMLAIPSEPAPAKVTSTSVQGPSDAVMHYIRVRRIDAPPGEGG